MSMPSRAASIDTARLIAALGVVSIHCNTLQSPVLSGEWQFLGSIIDILSRAAVPLFFVISGYFLGIKIRNGWSLPAIVSKNSRRLILLLAFWYFIYLIVPTDWATVQKDGYPRAVYWSAIALFDDISSLLHGPRRHLWFLSALLLGSIHALTVVYVLKFRWLPIFAYFIAIYILGLTGAAYGAIPAIQGYHYGIPSSLLFPPLLIGLGVAIGRVDALPTLFVSWFVFISGTFLIFIEALLLNVGYAVPFVGHDMLIGTPIQALGLLLLLLSNPSWSSRSSLPVWGQYGLGIYTTHVAVIELSGASQSGDLLWELTKVPLVFIATLALVMLLSRIRVIRSFFV